jgi:hypothetical protein
MHNTTARIGILAVDTESSRSEAESGAVEIIVRYVDL